MNLDDNAACEKKFAQINADLGRMEHFQKFHQQFCNGVLFVLGIGGNKTTRAGFRINLGSPQPVTGWRKEIFDRLKGTILQELNVPEVTAENMHEVFAKMLGLMANLEYASEQTEADPQLESEICDKALALLIEVPPNAEIPDLDPPAALAQILRAAPPSRQVKISDAYGKGAKAIFNDNLDFTYDRGLAALYCMLLYLDDYTKAFNTIEELHAFLKTGLPGDKLGTIDTFRKVCTRIKLKVS